VNVDSIKDANGNVLLQTERNDGGKQGVLFITFVLWQRLFALQTTIWWCILYPLSRDWNDTLATTQSTNLNQ